MTYLLYTIEYNPDNIIDFRSGESEIRFSVKVFDNKGKRIGIVLGTTYITSNGKPTVEIEDDEDIAHILGEHFTSHIVDFVYGCYDNFGKSFKTCKQNIKVEL